jgi:signal transduction histidine kinase
VGDSSLLERLTTHRTLASVPREELAWVAAHGRLRTLNAGDILTPSTGPVAGLYIVLNGYLSIHVDRGAGRRKVTEWRAGDITGLLPYSRLKAPPGNVVAEEPTEIVMVDAADLPQMTRECYELTAVLVHVMVDRVRVFRGSELLDEKMLSLGRLAAGLAHELNNPASAVARSAQMLRSELPALQETMQRFCGMDLSDEQCGVVSAVRNAADAGDAVDVRTRSPIDVADREDAMAAWLTSLGHHHVHVEPLAESAMEVEDLKRLSATVRPEQLPVVLDYLASSHTVGKLAAEIETAATRIHTLVAAVKGFTYMDHNTVPEPVAIGQGLSDTLTILRPKAKSKSVEVTLDLPVGLPAVDGYGGELNQVWANLVDNAIDATPGGHVRVQATASDAHVVVRVVDDGPGMTPEVLNRIFDPFFTTKKVGEGTGLGLDIARRIVQRHHGDIEVVSSTGGTEFRVSLPASPAKIPVPSHAPKPA